MRFWPLLTILLLARQPDLRGQESGDEMKKGMAALDSGLWEIAEMHFRNTLANSPPSPEIKSQLIVRLAEALIREGNATEALTLLDQSAVADNPEVPFWKAMALIAQVRFSEAAGLFSTLLANPTAPHRIEAGFTLASLQLSLGLDDAALSSLSNLHADASPDEAVRIRLYQAEVFMDLGRVGDARKAMPDRTTVDARDRPLAEFLEAQLQLREGRADAAEARFRLILNQGLTRPAEGLSLDRHQMAAIGLAESIHAQGDPEAATRILLDFIQDHPDSPLLDAMFARILEWLPEKPSATDPALERLAQWIPAPTLPLTAGVPGATGGSAVSAWPVNPASGASNNLAAYSIHTRAMGLNRIATPEARAEARRLWNRLRIEYAGHFLIAPALYQLARGHLADGRPDLAFSILDTLRETAGPAPLKGRAAFLEARESYQKGDLDSAAKLFDEASRSLAGDDARAARRLSALSRIRGAGPGGTTLIQLEGDPPDKELEADLTLERALTATPPESSRAALDDFLTRFPDHPRAAEARLAAAEAALSGATPDPSFAAAQLDALAAQPDVSAKLPQARIALARLRIADLKRDSAAVIATAQSIIDAYPASPEAAEAEFALGRGLYQSGNYNPARLALEKLAARDTDLPRAQAAWLLAARSAALGSTEASKKEALILFDKAIETGGPVTAIASLEKARHLIDMSRFDEASGFLGGWVAGLPQDDPLQLPAGLLLGEALSAQGGSNPASLVAALAVYDKLLAQAGSHPALLNRLQYLRGRTLELMPDAKDPTKTRERQAFQAYHSVLETTSPPAEWEYFELCAFRALALLEKAGRWQAAIQVAKKIASFKGPRAEQAASRANEIQLKQMLWED